MFFFVHRTPASCLYIDGDILSYFTLAGYVLWFYAYQQETFCSKEDVVESGKVAALIWCTLRHVGAVSGLSAVSRILRLSWRLSTLLVATAPCILLVAAALCILLVAALAVGIAGPGLIRWCPSATRTSGRVAALGHLRHFRSLCMRLCITHGENHGAAQRQHHHDGDGILDPSFRNRFHIVDLLSNLVVLRDGCIIQQNA